MSEAAGTVAVTRAENSCPGRGEEGSPYLWVSSGSLRPYLRFDGEQRYPAEEFE
jgi:hypothetical protein